MGILKKILFFIVVLTVTVAISSCAKNNYSHNYRAKSMGTAPTIDPLSKKTTPVRKKYVISSKQKKILGQEKPRI